MVISEIALGFLTNLLYDSFKSIPKEISDTYSKIYDQAIEEFSNKNYKLTGIQIDTFFHQENVERAIEKYLKNPDKIDCSKILINEFFELFSEEDFSREDADLILNTFFEILDTEVEKYPELIKYLDHYLAKRTDKTVQEIYKVISESRENQSKKDSGVDFEKSIEKYLKKIIEENGKTEISEVYTELSAKEVLPISLKFHDKESDKPKEFEVLELVEKEEKLIISGESGSGKTTTLRWLNFTFATNYLEKKEDSIPLYIELNSYIRGPFYDYIKNQIKKKGLLEVALKALLEEKAIIFLDGFDLLSSTESFSPYDEISNFISEYSNCRFIVSSRPGFFESIKSDFKVSELKKLTDEKIQIFIERYVDEKELAEVLESEILDNDKLKSILTNPMMLYLVIRVLVERKRSCGENSFIIEDSLTQNRSEIYKIFVSDLFKYNEKSRKPLHTDSVQIENALTDLFFELQCKKHIQYKEALQIVKKHADDPIFRKTTAQDIIKDCCELGLLKRNNLEVEYGFHQSFQEYFAAIKLKELFENGYDISEAFSHPKWEEVVIFTSEMLDSDLLNKYIDLMVSKGELFLASKCVNKASNNTKKKLCALLADKVDSRYTSEKMSSIESLGRIGAIGISIIAEALKDEDEDVRANAARALGNIKSDTAVQPLINALKDKNLNVRADAADALGNIKSDTAVQPLINALKDENSYVSWSAAKALGNIKSDTVLQLLINALKDENLRGSAANALGNIKSDIAVQMLTNALKDEDEDVRANVARALGNIKSDTAVQPLINALKDKNLDVQWNAAMALGNIKSDTAVKTLINALKGEDEDVRANAAAALGTIKSDTAVKTLINALKDKDLYVRANAAMALRDIKSNTAVQPLINTLKDEDSYVRANAADALGNIKSNTAVQPLINALKDKNSYVQRSAAMALGNIKSDIAVQPLINSLKDKNSYVRGDAARELGNIESDTAVQPLINALKDEDSYVRWNAAMALGNIKSDIAVQPLINSLKDKDKDARGSAAMALGNIKSDIAVQPLINSLKDKNSNVRWSATVALGKIKSDTAVQLLINALKDEDLYIRMNAADALGNIKSDTAVQPLINALKDEDSLVRKNAADALGKICTVKNKKQLEDLLESDHEFLANTAFEILDEIEKEEKSKLILFKDLKKQSEIIIKYSIFVSSVQKELENERVTIQDLLENDPYLSSHYTSLLYEYEPAYSEKTLDGCLNALNSCQVYLLIVGVKYGTLVGEISITHREYRYAKEKNLPILVFIKGERNIEREPGTEALLREIDSDDFKYKRFRNVIELKNEVNESLKKLLRDDEKFLKT